MFNKMGVRERLKSWRVLIRGRFAPAKGGEVDIFWKQPVMENMKERMSMQISWEHTLKWGHGLCKDPWVECASLVLRYRGREPCGCRGESKGRVRDEIKEKSGGAQHIGPCTLLPVPWLWFWLKWEAAGGFWAKEDVILLIARENWLFSDPIKGGSRETGEEAVD